MKKTKRTDDTGVLRQYIKAKENPMFDQITHDCMRFVRYEEAVPCALCGRQSKHHWTCIVRFKTADIEKGFFTLQMSLRWFPAGKPVCRAHIMQPDRAEYIRRARAHWRKVKKAKHDTP